MVFLLRYIGWSGHRNPRIFCDYITFFFFFQEKYRFVLDLLIICQHGQSHVVCILPTIYHVFCCIFLWPVCYIHWLCNLSFHLYLCKGSIYHFPMICIDIVCHKFFLAAMIWLFLSSAVLCKVMPMIFHLQYFLGS